MFKLVKLRERKTKDLYHIRCVKNEDKKILVKEVKIKKRYYTYF